MKKTWIYVLTTATYEAGDNCLHQEVEAYDDDDKAMEAFQKKCEAMHNDIYGEADENTADGISEQRGYRDYEISREPGTEFEYQGKISCECRCIGHDEQDFIPFCKEHILNHIDDYEGQSHYGCDLGDYLTETMNADGTFTYSTAKARELLQAWWDDAADYSEYEDFNFGKRSNPFENVEAFLVRMVIEGVNGLMGKLPIIEENWNDELELTPEVIATIKEQVEELSDDEEVF